MRLRERFFGDRAFYRMVAAIALPILVQNAITNLVSLLDNVMVGRLGTDPMSGVAIVNQLLFVFNMSIFGRRIRRRNLWRPVLWPPGSGGAAAYLPI